MNLEYRKYTNYKEYLAHQKTKHRLNESKFIKAFDRRYRLIRNRLNNLVCGIEHSGIAICLGARRGEEVKALRDMGFDAVGIDLYPGKNNRYVIYGDFHNMPFSDKYATIIYTNCLDHSFDIKKIVLECRRVLVPGGHMLLEISNNVKLTTKYKDNNGQKHIDRPKRAVFESMIWGSIEDVVNVFTHNGFKEKNRKSSDRFTGVSLVKL